MAKISDREEICEAYNNVRDDNTETNWCCLKYDDSNSITMDSTGVDFDELKGKFSEDERVYAYLRMVVGDEMSKRMKFAFITWCGPKVSPMKKAKLSTDKTTVKQIFSSFAVEMLCENLQETKEEVIREAVTKAGGANYGTGQH